METRSERRRRKLSELCDAFGLKTIAEDAELSPLYLSQIIKGVKLPPKADGTRSARALGDTAARAIETKRGLGIGWFDNDKDDIPMSPSELKLLGAFRDLPPNLQELLLETAVASVERHRSNAENMQRTLQLSLGKHADPVKVSKHLKPAPKAST